MKNSKKEYRFKDNPKEKEFHDKFIKMFGSTNSGHKMLSSIIYGWKNNTQTIPFEWLNNQEEFVCINLIQWLGSPVGQSFLADCGFKLEEK